MRSFGSLLSLLMLSVMAGCAPASPPKAAVQPLPADGGTILSMRAVTTAAADGPMHAVLSIDGAPGEARSVVEFIVRADNGATLSIVQSNAPGFHTGDRVVILHDDAARLARPG